MGVWLLLDVNSMARGKYYVLDFKVNFNCFCTIQLPALRPKKLMHISKPQKTVSRAYGGSRCARCVRERYNKAIAKYNLKGKVI